MSEYLNSEMTGPDFFYVPNHKGYRDMNSCVAAEGSGMLVANPRLLDTVSELRAELAEARKDARLWREAEANRAKELAEARAEVERLKAAWSDDAWTQLRTAFEREAVLRRALDMCKEQRNSNIRGIDLREIDYIAGQYDAEIDAILAGLAGGDANDT